MSMCYDKSKRFVKFTELIFEGLKPGWSYFSTNLRTCTGQFYRIL